MHLTLLKSWRYLGMVSVKDDLCGGLFSTYFVTAISESEALKSFA